MSRKLVAAVAAIVVAVVAATALAQTSTPPGGTLTFKELEKGSKFSFIDNPPRSKRKGEPSASLGDDLTFSNPLADAGGNRIGTLYVRCTIVRASRLISHATTLCHGAFSFPGKGTLMLEALPGSLDAKSVTGAVSGGTGSFANARGTFTSTNTKTGSDDTVTFAG